MKAKCPNCKGSGCDKCKDGYVEFEFAAGMLYIPKCRDCGAEIPGFHISEDGSPPAENLVEGCCCVECDSENVSWELEGYSSGGEDM